eukprot:87860-Prorocentrum_minimum.AAC.1
MNFPRLWVNFPRRRANFPLVDRIGVDDHARDGAEVDRTRDRIDDDADPRIGTERQIGSRQ